MGNTKIMMDFKIMCWKTEQKEITGDISEIPSMTIPDQSVTIEELMYRHQNGLALGNITDYGRGDYELDEDIDDMLDFTELEESMTGDPLTDMELVQKEFENRKRSISESLNKRKEEKKKNEKVEEKQEEKTPEK